MSLGFMDQKCQVPEVHKLLYTGYKSVCKQPTKAPLSSSARMIFDTLVQVMKIFAY